MTGRTLFVLAFSAQLTLAACQTPETASSTTPAPMPDMSGWRLSSGKAPTKAEFTALAATCQDQSKGGSLDTCFNELGLKKAQ